NGGDGAAAARRDLARRLMPDLAVDIRDRDRGAFARQRAGIHAADAGPGAGDDCNLALQTHASLRRSSGLSFGVAETDRRSVCTAPKDNPDLPNHGVAAADAKDLAGDVAGEVGGEEEHRSGEILGRA